MSRVAVLGAGVIGLSTAVNIQERIPGCHVTIVADQFGQSTTSSGAGAIIVPWAPGIDDATRRKWGVPSMDHFTKLAVSEESADSGAIMCMGIIYGPNPEIPQYHDFMPLCQPLPRATAKKLNLDKYHCFTLMTVMVEMTQYLPWLMRRFKANGGEVVNKHVHSLREFLGSYDLVVNCAGLGARSLTEDNKMAPVRGQILRVKAPWMKIMIQQSGMPGDLKPLAFPNINNVVMGGTKQEGRSDLEADPQTSKDIWKAVTEIWPPLKAARVESEWVGLRPQRSPPRLEAQPIRFGNQTLKVVHNYGHGATGVSVAWGCAIHATELVQQQLKPSARL